MTYADKYLKNGVNVEDFIDEIKHIKQVIDWKGEPALFICYLKDWLNTSVKPTLSEDEKVILKNIYHTKNTIIGRDDEVLFVYSQDNTYCTKNYNLNLFNHLFQFIKPRRRILHRRTFERRMKVWKIIG